MSEIKKSAEQFVFGLDIGTRSIVGTVGYMNKNKFHVVAQYMKEHDTRAMMDGQIHDIEKVTQTIAHVKRELENQSGMNLKEVCIAAAGRVLKTMEVHVDYKLSDNTKITNEHVYSLDTMGIEQAYEMIRSEDTGIKFYCVGYTVIKYYLNDYVIMNLEGHTAKKISADVLVTFLPEEVVTGLYTAVEGAGLQVANLTLEPIAAINIAIPQNYRLLNIALVDVGAGTSDISITKDGSIIAYGMIPHAGDELTECLVSKFLVEFSTAEKIKRSSISNRAISFKDIMGLKQKVSPAQVREAYEPVVESMTKEIADKIKELNGGKSVNAVFVVGGGGKVVGFCKSLANYLDIPEERVALRGSEVLSDVQFEQTSIKKDSMLVTPVGICLSFYDQKNSFIFVNINDERIKLYNNDKLTVLDAAMQIDYPNEDLFPKRGDSIEYYVNNEKRVARGQSGEPATITVNGEAANINSKIIKNDKIVITPSTTGEGASITISKLPEYKHSMEFVVNKQTISCPCFALVNNELQSGDYQIKNNDHIEILNYYTVEQLLTFMDLDFTSVSLYVNNRLAIPSDKVYENFTLDFEPLNDTPKFVGDDEDEDGINEDGINEDGINEDTVASETGDSEIHAHPAHNTVPVSSNPVSHTATIDTANSEHTETTDIPVIHSINLTVNGTPVILSGKTGYVFVDILTVYPFDTSTLGGSSLLMTINGEMCDFTSVVNNGDIIELKWIN